MVKLTDITGSSNGRTMDSESINLGPNPSPVAKKMDKTYCIFGDSVTQAAYVKVGWVDSLKAYLEKKYKDDFVNVFNLGVGGNTTNDILVRFEAESSVRMPTSIIFAVGVNDSGYHRTISKPIVDERIFESNLENLVAKSTKFFKDITFVGPVLGDDSILKPFPAETEDQEWSYDRKRVIDYGHILERVTNLRSCRFIQLLGKLNPEDFQDGLHPNKQGHKKMFEIIKRYF